ncbi:hypothetical protein G3578_10640 [Brevibacillus sp. SYP-B805]|uniref:hypothetical protein n=1 Tax=Brevibacillus sp. SYP-B805 TaxID=1578199 RepID=UPI0013E9B584|nr:hypothetical protein [Brevibacillus sp. SYP-B805]NGQ95610.1 hypothetical protein [Brevibacillus sp. SYP-B805]
MINELLKELDAIQIQGYAITSGELGTQCAPGGSTDLCQISGPGITVITLTGKRRGKDDASDGMETI